MEHKTSIKVLLERSFIKKISIRTFIRNKRKNMKIYTKKMKAKIYNYMQEELKVGQESAKENSSEPPLK